MRVGAVVVNHDSGDDLGRCLEALSSQTVPLEVVLVDCASSDASRRLVDHPPAGVRALPLEANAGYAGGCAAGLAALPAEVAVVGFFNPDCFPAPGLFAACLALLAGDPTVGGVAPRLLREGGELLDSCGQRLTPLTLMVRDRGYGEPATGRFTERSDVLAACGAAMIFRRAALEAAAVAGDALPREFFAFWEDLDLGWRVTNAGYRVVYEPAAVAVHRRAATAAPGHGRLVFRRPAALAACVVVNRWATMLRNLHTLDFLLRLPVLLLWDAAMIGALILRRPRVAVHLWRALPRLRLAWVQRRATRRRRLAELP